MISYRADIDGLRAAAVMAVVLYHFDLAGFTGGFVGVDVFFVISGFLITGLIKREIEDERFSLVHFYERRIRRIFPALIVLLIAVGIIAHVELFPAGYRSFGQSLAATSVFLSNFEFWREAAGYFEALAQDKPLLHTWSLAVEEQFYLLFPPLLMLLSRHRKRWTIGVFAVLAAMSFGFSLWDPQGTGFYLFPGRMWELLLGALIAVGAFPIVAKPWARNTLATIGLLMIGWAVFTYAPPTVFPSRVLLPVLALSAFTPVLPCVGTALIIHAGLAGQPAVNRMLSAKPIVFVGLISYSLYLWHWPLYVFATHHVGRSLSLSERVGLIVLSFAIATLSFRFIEQPFRRPGGVATRRQIFLQGATAMAVFAVAGTGIYLANGMPERFTPDVQALLAPQTNFRTPRCEMGSEETSVGPLCRIGRPGGAPTFLVWGDSHALALSPAVSVAADRHGYSGLVTTGSGCAPLLGRYSYWPSPYEMGCRRHNDAILDFLKSGTIRTVILGAQWAPNAEGTLYNAEGVRFVGYGQDDESEELSPEETHRVFVRSFNRTIDALRAQGLKVVVAGPVPEVGLNVPMTLARRRMSGLSEDIGPTLAQFEARNKLVLETFDAAGGAAEFVYPHRTLCIELHCTVMRDGRPLYFDGTHLDRIGSESISAIFEPVFSGH